MSNVADFLKENCNTIGQGDLTLTGAADGSVGRFRDAWSVQTEVYYAILDGANRETGIGTFNGIGTISRDTVHATILNGIYNNTDPTPLDLGGVSVVACTLSANAFQYVIDQTIINVNHATRTDNPHVVTSPQVSYTSQASDLISASADIDGALVDHSVAIGQNQLSAVTNASAIADNAADIDALESTMAVIDDDVSYRESAITAMEAISGNGVEGNGPTSVLVSAGNGEIIDSYSDTENQVTTDVSWVETTYDLLANAGMPVETGLGYTEIGINDVGEVVNFPNGMSSAQRRKNILLAEIEYLNRVITSVVFKPIVSNQMGNIVLDMFDFMPFTNKLTGLVLRPTEIGDLSVWRDSGSIFTPGINYSQRDDQNVRPLDAIGAVDTAVPFILVAYNNGSTLTGSEVTQVPNDVYEPDGAGDIDGLGNGRTTIHYIYQSLGGQFFLSYGQREYEDFPEALNNLFADRSSHLVPAEMATFVLLGQCVIDKGVNTWAPGLAEIYPINSATASGSAGGTISQAINISYTDTYALGTNVQVALDSLAALKLSPDQHDAINVAEAPSAANVYITESALDNAIAPLQSYTGKNILINGDKSVSQRGDFTVSAAATNNTYSIDRWMSILNVVTANLIHKQFSVEAGNSETLRLTVTNTAQGYLALQQNIENYNAYAGRTVTLTMMVKSNVDAVISMDDGINAAVYSAHHTGSGSWEQLSVSFTLSNTPTRLIAWVGTFDGGTQSHVPGDYIELGASQLELGSEFTGFEIVPPAIQLANCQRYYVKVGTRNVFSGGKVSSNNLTCTVSLPVQLRDIPAIDGTFSAYVRGPMANTLVDQNIIGGEFNTNQDDVTVISRDMTGVRLNINSSANAFSYVAAYSVSLGAGAAFDSELY